MYGAVKITTNADYDKYKYSGYGICFDARGQFSIDNIDNGRNVLIFGCNMGSSTHTNNQLHKIYILGDGVTQGINGGSINAEKIYKTNFAQANKKFVLSLHWNDDDSCLFLNGIQEA